MSEALIAAILGALVKYGPELTIQLLTDLKGGKTIDDAIAALTKASLKTAQQYKDEDKATTVSP